MTAQQYTPAVSATTDSNGACVFVFPPPAAQDLAVLGTLTVNSGPAGRFEGFVGPNSIGQWQGAATVGPVYYQAFQTLQIVATGLAPNTQYVAQLNGIVDEADQLDATVGQPVAAPGLAASEPILSLAGADRAVPGMGGAAYRYFPTETFAALRIGAVLRSGGPLVITATWWSPGPGTAVGSRTWIIGPSAPSLQVAVPHLGDLLEIDVVSGVAGASVLDLTASHTSQPHAAWGGEDIANAPTTSVPATTTITLLAPPYIFGGPAHLEFDPGGASANYTMTLDAQDADGTWDTFLKRSNLDPGLRQEIDFYCPAQPIRMQATNGTAAAHNVEGTILYDLHRVG